MLVDIGAPAPDFDLLGDTQNPDNPEQCHRLSSYRGKKVVLYFYPKDDTSGCTSQACDFRDQLTTFNAVNTVVLGISRDTLKAHEKFRAKYGLTFPLLSDADGSVCNAYGTWVEKSMYGKKYFGIDRSTFLIDEAGIIQKIWRKVKVAGHVEEVLAALETS